MRLWFVSVFGCIPACIRRQRAVAPGRAALYAAVTSPNQTGGSGSRRGSHRRLGVASNCEPAQRQIVSIIGALAMHLGGAPRTSSHAS
jgi:hypothetical protein